jgi:hypothetical protein
VATGLNKYTTDENPFGGYFTTLFRKGQGVDASERFLTHIGVHFIEFVNLDRLVRNRQFNGLTVLFDSTENGSVTDIQKTSADHCRLFLVHWQGAMPVRQQVSSGIGTRSATYPIFTARAIITIIRGWTRTSNQSANKFGFPVPSAKGGV